jgi:hypothetical protein
MQTRRLRQRYQCRSGCRRRSRWRNTAIVYLIRVICYELSHILPGSGKRQTQGGHATYNSCSAAESLEMQEPFVNTTLANPQLAGAPAPLQYDRTSRWLRELARQATPLRQGSSPSRGAAFKGAGKGTVRLRTGLRLAMKSFHRPPAKGFCSSQSGRCALRLGSPRLFA